MQGQASLLFEDPSEDRCNKNQTKCLMPAVLMKGSRSVHMGFGSRLVGLGYLSSKDKFWGNPMWPLAIPNLLLCQMIVP